LEKITSLIRIIQDDQPRTISLILEPTMEELEDICFRIIASSDPKLVDSVANTLFEASSIAGMDPQYPCIWQPIPHTIAILNSQL
jgi:hypothetical protein